MPKKQKSREIDTVKGLLVGINYRGTQCQLGGCINDALTTKQGILSEYPNALIELLTDDTTLKPTRTNILSRLALMVSSATAGDTLIFHYSGHGSQVPDLDGDEEDGYDETICPIDFRTPRRALNNGTPITLDSQITDDEIHDIISRVPQGVRFLMLSDSCHSGTIGDLKNDLAHYPSGGVTSNNGEGLGVYRENHNDVVSIITCQSYWIYVRARGEVWLTPMDDTLYKSFGERALAIRVNSIPKMLAQNYNNPIKSVTEFKLLASGGYIIDAPEIGIKKLAASCFSPRVKGDGVRGMPKYSYNRDTGTHSHIHGHKKCTFSMRTPSAHGGDLRVISGCEENQTSADTGKNGACTRAFWQTVVSVGGLRSFFIKLFSSHVEDLKVIQDSINYNLSRYGFTQHSIVSWEQAGQRVLHEYNASIGINGCGFTSQDIPQLVNDSRGIITNPTYTHYRI